jgi:hypothetical protein
MAQRDRRTHAIARDESDANAKEEPKRFFHDPVPPAYLTPRKGVESICAAAMNRVATLRNRDHCRLGQVKIPLKPRKEGDHEPALSP